MGPGGSAGLLELSLGEVRPVFCLVSKIYKESSVKAASRLKQERWSPSWIAPMAVAAGFLKQERCLGFIEQLAET